MFAVGALKWPKLDAATGTPPGGWYGAGAPPGRACAGGRPPGGTYGATTRPAPGPAPVPAA